MRSDEFELYEMANIDRHDHYIDSAVKFHIMQPGKWMLDGHGPRLKLYKGGWKQSNSKKTITGVKIGYTANNVEILYDGLHIKGNEKKEIIKHIIKYRLAYILMWLDAGMTRSELVNQFELIDTNRSSEVLKEIQWLL